VVSAPITLTGRGASSLDKGGYNLKGAKSRC